MKKGDVVKFKNIIDAGDENVRMVLLEDPDGGRVFMFRPLGSRAE